MFGFLKARPRRIGAYTIRVFQPDWDECSVEYVGGTISKSHDLLLRGFYISKTLFTVGNVEAAAMMLAFVARLCRQLDEGAALDDDTTLGVRLVHSRQALVKRYSQFEIGVHASDQVPTIETDLPQGLAVGEVLASAAAFTLSWFQRHGVSPDSMSAKASLQFFVGLLQYYDQDPLAFRSAQSVFQAPFKAYVLANSNIVGLMGLDDSESQ